MEATSSKRLRSPDWAGGASRVYAADVLAATGWGLTWLGEQIRRGRFPAPRVDPGGRRRWWTREEAVAALERVNAAAERTAGGPR